MFALPAPTAFIKPVDEPIVATDVLLLLQTPPGVTLARDVDANWQSVVVPVITLTVGATLTVAIFVTKQAPGIVYVITAVPVPAPVTVPVEDPTVATDGLPLVHAPPDTEFVRVVLLPTHTVATPPIDAGMAFTVKLVVADTDPHPFVFV